MSYRAAKVVRTCTAAVAGGLVASSILIAPPANAYVVTAVKARSQKMAFPDLRAQQNGWYEPGVQVALVCMQIGQAVQGYNTPKLPNGGWDNHWYQTTDGNFIAGVNLDTRALPVDAIAPQCRAAPSGSPRTPVDAVPPPISGRFAVDGNNGIDYAVPVGTPVYASDAGTVMFAGLGEDHPWMTASAGNCVLIRHFDEQTAYLYLDQISVSNGQDVTKGQLIGYSGATGAAGYPHLHFEVLPLTPNFSNAYGGRTDPQRYLG